MMNLHSLLAQADFVSINCDLNPTSYHLINEVSLEWMKPSAVLINTARGPIVHEDALIEALQAGRLAGAALDVFAEEPYSGPLLELENVVLTPHLAASTQEAQDRAGVIVAEQVAAALEGGVVTNAVNTPSVAAEDLDALHAELSR